MDHAPSPRWTEAWRFPVVTATGLLAIGATGAWAFGLDVSAFLEAAAARSAIYSLITSVFFHATPFHLLFNLYWLWVFGTAIERTWGHGKTLGLILLLALGSSAWEFAVFAGGVGLSGVGYGFFGLLWVLSRRDERFHHAVGTNTIQIFVGWFFVCIVATVYGAWNIANVAHGVGALLGGLVGFAIVQPSRRRHFAWAAAAVLLAGLWAATWGRPFVNVYGVLE